jgi:hypothetical protein
MSSQRRYDSPLRRKDSFDIDVIVLRTNLHVVHRKTTIVARLVGGQHGRTHRCAGIVRERLHE